MNTFAFNPREKIGQHYHSFLKRMKQHDYIWDAIKVGILLFGLTFFIFMYLYYVSLASTRWYFLRQATQRRSTILFQHEIVKTQILKIKQTKWQEMRDPTTPNTLKNNNTNIIKITIPYNEA
jgi:hypothetical protein